VLKPNAMRVAVDSGLEPHWFMVRMWGGSQV
jgi:hypothetical protein